MVQGEVPQVVVVAGDVRVEGRVTGNVVVVLGDVVLAKGARIDGDLVVLGGSVEGSNGVGRRTWVVGGQVSGRGAPAAWTFLRLGLWLVLSFLLVAFLPRGVRGVGEVVGQQPLATVAGGLGFLLVWLAMAVLVGVTVGGGMQLVFWALLSGVFVGVKVLGVIAFAWAIGRKLRAWLPPSLCGEFSRTGFAVAGLFLLSALPWVGPAIWVVVSVVGVGGVVVWALAWVPPAVREPARP